MRDTITVSCPICDAEISLAITVTDAESPLSPRETLRLTGFRARTLRTAHLDEPAPQRCDHNDPQDVVEADSLTFTIRERQQLAKEIKRELRAIERGEYEV